MKKLRQGQTIYIPQISYLRYGFEIHVVFLHANGSVAPPPEWEITTKWSVEMIENKVDPKFIYHSRRKAMTKVTQMRRERSFKETKFLTAEVEFIYSDYFR